MNIHDIDWHTNYSLNRRGNMIQSFWSRKWTWRHACDTKKEEKPEENISQLIVIQKIKNLKNHTEEMSEWCVLARGTVHVRHEGRRNDEWRGTTKSSFQLRGKMNWFQNKQLVVPQTHMQKNGTTHTHTHKGTYKCRRQIGDSDITKTILSSWEGGTLAAVIPNKQQTRAEGSNAATCVCECACECARESHQERLPARQSSASAPSSSMLEHLSQERRKETWRRMKSTEERD